MTRPLSDFGDRRLWGRDLARDMERVAPEAEPRLTVRDRTLYKDRAAQIVPALDFARTPPARTDAMKAEAEPERRPLLELLDDVIALVALLLLVGGGLFLLVGFLG